MSKYTNFKMETMLNDLQPVLQYKSKVGYVAARNTRIIRDTLTEYFQFRDDLIRKYGSPEMDDNGKPTGRIAIIPGSEGYENFNKEIRKIGEIEHEIELMTLKYDDVIEVLSGEEMLNLDWMLTD